MIKFLFVRHGQSHWTHKMIRMGYVDAGLNESGVEHAKNAAFEISQRLKREKQCILLTSTLKRAKETAAIIAKHTKCDEIIELEQLREKYFGDYSLAKNPSSDAESEEELHARILIALQEIQVVAEQTQKDIVVVSHGYFYKHMCKIVSSYEKSELDFGEVSEIELDMLYLRHARSPADRELCKKTVI